MSVIYAFGDSITYGAWDVQMSGWAARLRQYIDDLQEKNPDYYALLYNLGIPGETTAGLVKRFDNEYNARFREERGEESLFILAFGANDAAFLPAENKFRVSKEAFKVNLEQVISRALAISKKIILVNILPVSEEMNSVLRNGKIRLNKYMEEYNSVLKELADRFGVELIDVFTPFVTSGHRGLLNVDDGLHPNDKGHEMMFEMIKPVILKMLGWEWSK